MEWSCHSCGESHPSIPEACRSCGATPQIFKNAWKCPTCGHEGNDGDKTRCEGCGKDRDKDALTALTAERFQGARALALANGTWRFCAFCQTQVAPVDGQGKPVEACPTCRGPLDVAVRHVVAETVAEADARTYAAQKTQVAGSEAEKAKVLPPPPDVPASRGSLNHPPAPTRSWDFPPQEFAAPQRPPVRWGLLAGVGAAVLVCIGLYAALRGYSRDAECSVTGRDWSRSVVVEVGSWHEGEGWSADAPVGALRHGCEPRYHHTDQVFTHNTYTYTTETDTSRCVSPGTRPVTKQVATGTRCAQTGVRKNGSTSVVTCLRRETVYEAKSSQESFCRQYGTKQVPHPVPHYIGVPRNQDYCRWRLQVWTTARTLREGDSGAPRWPEVALGPEERQGRRSEDYVLRLSCPAEKENPAPSHSLSQGAWETFSVGSRVTAHMIGNTVTSVRPR